MVTTSTDVTLTPTFSSGVIPYTASVTVDEVTLTAEANDDDAVVTVTLEVQRTVEEMRRRIMDGSQR